MSINDVASPCINICKIDEPTQRCIGCDRNIDEITRWRLMSNEARQEVIDGIIERKAQQKAQLKSQRIKGLQIEGQQSPITPSKPSKSEIIAAGLPGNRSAGCE